MQVRLRCYGFVPQDHSSAAFFRWLIVLGGGLVALYGAHLIHYDGAGGLAAIILSLVASMQWRKEGWGEHNPVSIAFNRMWIILEPVIFALIGTEIQVDKIDPATLGRVKSLMWFKLDVYIVFDPDETPGSRIWGVSPAGCSRHSDGWHLFRRLLRKPEHQGENLYGVCLDAKGNGAGGPWAGFP